MSAILKQLSRSATAPDLGSLSRQAAMRLTTLLGFRNGLYQVYSVPRSNKFKKAVREHPQICRVYARVFVPTVGSIRLGMEKCCSKQKVYGSVVEKK
jgi:hypothetical protein